MKAPIQIAVTGAAGQIGYALLPRIASGEMFGHDQPVSLRLLEVEQAQKALIGVVMELEDCAFPLVQEIVATTKPDVAFKGASWVILVGGMPRKAGMERKDLLTQNAAIFAEQGRTIEAYAANDVRILVVANPCNTNCSIARMSAPKIPADRWFAMMRLDENRAKAMLAKKAGVSVGSVTRMTIWGNHSSTQFPDAQNALINGKSCFDVIGDHEWLRNDFVSAVQQRGSTVIEQRGLSSAASAANAIIDTIKSLTTPTSEGDWTSVAVVSSGEYGVPEGLQFGFPIRTDGVNWDVVPDISLNNDARARIKVTIDELIEERAMLQGL